MRDDPLRTITLTTVEATPETTWTFLEIETEAGVRGVGEASLTGRETAVAEAVVALARMAFSLSDCDPASLPPYRPSDLPQAAAISALDQAMWDVNARRHGQALAEALGPVRRDRINVYANINRRTRDRSPAGFADSARAAVLAGHRSIKLAPFDEMRPGAPLETLTQGFARVAAVREAVDPDIGVMVDCHWRLDEVSAREVIDALAERGVGWIECPLIETPATANAIAKLRGAANRRGLVLAGLETAIGLDGFMPFIRAGSYDVVMPDLKYVGGLVEALRLADALCAAGIGFSPHNPSGPICHAASMHLCAVAEEMHSLEIQFDETPLFAELVGTDLHKLHAGGMELPDGPGLGAMLQQEPLTRRRVHRWRAAQSGLQAIEEGT